MSAAAGALRRAIGRSGAAVSAAELCDLCGVGVSERHRHVLDEHTGELLCACQACSLLFEREAAGRGHYRLVPTERRRLSDVSAHELGVPVSLAFFVPQPDGSVVAHYPSPMGATQWEVDPEAWQGLRGRNRDLADLVPGVQALLVNVARGHDEHWLVPIDDCYRLVALIRREWTGLSGGSTVWPAIDEFFAGLQKRR